MVLAYLLLANHWPVWYHQKLLFIVPAAMVAAYAGSEGITVWRDLLPKKTRLSWKSGSTYLRAGASLLVLAYLVTSPFAPSGGNIAESNAPQQAQVVPLNEAQEQTMTRVQLYAPKSNWMVTDIPMFAFRAGIAMPSNTAVFSIKRYLTGNLTEAEILEAIAAYEPEQIIFGRLLYPSVEAHLVDDYSLIACVYTDSGTIIRHYVKIDAVGPNTIATNCFD